MSHTLVSHSPDLTKLVEEGYDVEIRDGNLLVHHVPYVTATGTVDFGILVSELTTNGEATVRPGTHEIRFSGGVPHDHQNQVVAIVNTQSPHDFGNGLIAVCSMSGKRNGQMPVDYYDKIVNYVGILSTFARNIDPNVSHENYPVRESSPDESVFRYHDSASSRAGISAVSAKLKTGKVAIVGLGGTGAYILDLIAKTSVEEIHLFDDDVVYAHNAFRFPGAAALEELKGSPKKVQYLFEKYDPIRRGIVAHDQKMDASNIDELRDMAFVFIAIDAGSAKKVIVEGLVSFQVPFIDCGLGINRFENSLTGQLRVTTVTSENNAHVASRISFGDKNEDEYDWNIQTADLNMMNAVMAVIKWKKLFGYYVDRKHEFNSTYTVISNKMISGEFVE